MEYLQLVFGFLQLYILLYLNNYVDMEKKEKNDNDFTFYYI